MRVHRLEAGTLYVLLTVIAIFMFVPFFWMVSASLQTIPEVEGYPPVWLPKVPQWFNYARAWIDYGVGRALLNSVIVTFLGVGLQVMVCALAAYAFSRLRFPGRDAVFMLYLATMMIPHYVTIIPLYFMIFTVKLVDTYAALILPGMFSAFGTFLLRQFFNQIPTDLDEATVIDGGGHWHIFRYVIMPLAGPGLGALAIFSFMGHWNDLLWPVIVLNSKELFTLPLSLAMMVGQFFTVINVQMAGATIAVLPVVIMFMLMQRQFVESIARSGIRG